MYDHGCQETVDLFAEVWWRPFSAAVPIIISVYSTASDVPAVLADMLIHFINNPFKLHEAQVFPPYAAANAYDSEEQSF